MKLKVGQIWEYAGDRYKGYSRTVEDRDEIFELTGPMVAIEIVELNKMHPAGKKYHPCKVIRDDGNYLNLNIYDDNGLLIMLPGPFEQAIKEGQWTLLLDSKNTFEAGAMCIKCKQHYPYANPAPDFECWSCRNGF